MHIIIKVNKKHLDKINLGAFCVEVYIFPIILKNSNVEKRDNIRKKMADAAIQTSMHYPAVHRFSIYEDCKAVVPNTEYITDNLITLPLSE